MPKAIQLNPKTLKKIAEALFLAYTEEQAAYLGGISKRTLARIRETVLWQEILEMALAMEKPFRQKIYKGLPGWQGAAWMLERKYPGQLSKPEVQLSLSTSTSTTNNTLVITAEVAENLRTRNASLDQELQKLVPPANRTGPIIPIMGPEHISSASPVRDSIASQVSNRTESIDVVEEPPPAPAGGTPYAAAEGRASNLPPNSKSVENSRNYNESSSNSKAIETAPSLSPQRKKRVPPGIPRPRGRSKSLPPAPRGPMKWAKKQ